ncbi:FHA domain-containing protein [Stenotrophomonas sp. SY1]|uniref:FHA domain-containing protein n=1 Tax=Stenotrophomonas sp. SY1 TaxID=477235 RepID=UPI001E30E207|nr:FHA domain-containing protein [Stenotrophomonas sp. SY1]
MRNLQVHFSNRQQPDQSLTAGVQRIVRHASGQVRLGDGSVGPLLLAQFCMDQRGVWLQVANGVRGIHVNGRPVRRMALLRAGDSVYADGAEMLLRGDCEHVAQPPQPPAEAGDDQRVLLRGVGGRHHGRCYTLDKARSIGSDAANDIVIDDPTFAGRHASFERHGEKVLLRDQGSTEGTVVNGVATRHCWLQAGDQVVFEGNHRFVLEMPLGQGVAAQAVVADEPGMADEPAGAPAATQVPPRRWPWLLLSALLLGGAISVLLLFGAR